MIDIPGWIQAFVLGGIALLMVVVPVRVVWGMTSKSRRLRRDLQELAARLKGRFEGARVEGRFPAPPRIYASYEGRPVAVTRPRSDEIALSINPGTGAIAHAVIRTAGRIRPPFSIMWESLRILRRRRLLDPLVDDALDAYATPAFGMLLGELALDGAGGRAKPSALVESLAVLRRLPGVKWWEIRMSPSGGFRLRLRLRSDDLLYRPEDLESAAHHAFRLHDLTATA